jgi:hypothetical protein
MGPRSGIDPLPVTIDVPDHHGLGEDLAAVHRHPRIRLAKPVNEVRDRGDPLVDHELGVRPELRVGNRIDNQRRLASRSHIERVIADRPRIA